MTRDQETHKYWTLFAACLGTFILLIDVTVVVVALPSIRSSLHTSFSDVQWTIDAYALSLASLLLAFGSLGDILGRRRVFVVGLAMFTLGSLLCGIAQSGMMLVLCRAFQGIGGAIILPTSLALLAQTFHGKERGFAFGVWGAVSGAAGGIGPLLGGVLTTELSWRWIFYVNLPLGAIAILATLTRVREYRPAHARRIDVPGVVVFTLGLVALVYGLTESGPDGWGSLRVIASLAVAVVLLACFPLLERARPEPMFDIRLFRKPTFTGGALAAFGLSGSLWAMLLYITVYLQDAQHLSPLGAGLRQGILTLTLMLTAFPAGRASARIPVRWLVGAGLVLVGVGLLLMRGLSASSSWTHLVPGLIVAGFGAGLVNGPLASTAIGVVAPQDAGMASGINSTFRQVGLATSVAALGTIFAHRLAGATRTTIGVHYASALNEVLLIAGPLAIVTGAVSIALIRQRDFVTRAAPPSGAPNAPAGQGPPAPSQGLPAAT